MMARTVANERYRATLSSAFGGAALVLAAIGLFGLLTRAVNERRREIGVRMAVGAKPGDVVRLVMREGGEDSSPVVCSSVCQRRWRLRS